MISGLDVSEMCFPGLASIVVPSLICIRTNQSLNLQVSRSLQASEIASMVPGRKSSFAEPVVGGHTRSSGIDVQETVVEVQRFLAQVTPHPFHHRRSVGKERFVAVLGWMFLKWRFQGSHRRQYVH